MYNDELDLKWAQLLTELEVASTGPDATVVYVKDTDLSWLPRAVQEPTSNLIANYLISTIPPEPNVAYDVYEIEAQGETAIKLVLSDPSGDIGTAVLNSFKADGVEDVLQVGPASEFGSVIDGQVTHLHHSDATRIIY